MRRKLFAAVIPGLLLLSCQATAQQGFFVKPLAERKVAELPSGDLFWHLATFDGKEQAQQAAGPHGLVAEYDGKVWLFRLAQAGEALKGGTKVAEIGPVPRITAQEYLLRVNEAGGRRAAPPPRTPTLGRKRSTCSRASCPRRHHTAWLASVLVRAW
jgi:hypothetical protein